MNQAILTLQGYISSGKSAYIQIEWYPAILSSFAKI